MATWCLEGEKRSHILKLCLNFSQYVSTAIMTDTSNKNMDCYTSWEHMLPCPEVQKSSGNNSSTCQVPKGHRSWWDWTKFSKYSQHSQFENLKQLGRPIWSNASKRKSNNFCIWTHLLEPEMTICLIQLPTIWDNSWSLLTVNIVCGIGSAPQCTGNDQTNRQRGVQLFK